MKEPLRPFTLGDILDRTAHLYRSRFLIFLGIAAVPTAVILVFACAAYLLLAWDGIFDPKSVSNSTTTVIAGLIIGLGALVVLPVFLGVSALSSAAMSHAVARLNLGETTTIRDAYRTVWHRGWTYVGLYILQGLIISAVPIVVWVVLVFGAAFLAALTKSAGLGAAGGFLVALAVVVLVISSLVYMLYMLLRLSLCFPACVVEQIGAVDALRRTSKLSKGTKGRIFVLYLLGSVLNWILSMVLLVPVSITTALIPAASDPANAQKVAAIMFFALYGGMFAIQCFTRPVYGIGMVLFYYDQRIRQEGFDIEWMMLQAGMMTAPPSQVEAAPWLPPMRSAAQAAGPPTAIAGIENEKTGTVILEPRTEAGEGAASTLPPDPHSGESA